MRARTTEGLTEATGATGRPAARPGVIDRICGVLWGIGTLISAYLTFEHFTHNRTLACSASGVVDCAAVTSSSYSHLLGMPVALLGLLYFLAGLVLRAVLGRRTTPLQWARLRWGYAGLGLVFVLYLVWVELVPLGRICLWCTGIHVVVLLVFLLSMVQVLTAAPDRPTQA